MFEIYSGGARAPGAPPLPPPIAMRENEENFEVYASATGVQY